MGKRGEYHSPKRTFALIAVGNVVINRVKAQSGYGGTIQEVCLKPFHSCWNAGDEPSYFDG
jgi:hypothetical protein